MIVLELILNAVATGVVLGSIYALMALGLAITFGILHIPDVAHPALVIAGAYAVVISNQYGVDPILAGLMRPCRSISSAVVLCVLRPVLRVARRRQHAAEPDAVLRRLAGHRSGAGRRLRHGSALGEGRLCRA